MKIRFYKYHGTGNDFILLDNRAKNYSALSTKQIAFLCDRHFGIGADGLIMLQNDDELDFKMRYFNSDGREASMCGNGGRCIVAFSKELGIASGNIEFRATDGIHNAKIKDDIIELEMQAVNSISDIYDALYLNTGSPHYVGFTNNIDEIDIYNEGRNIRNNSKLFPDGTNVNFVEVLNNKTIRVRTYERGVEDETLSCGTGVIASSIAAFIKFEAFETNINIKTKGGELNVRFNVIDNGNNSISFDNIWLSGPAKFIFSGTIKI